MLLDRAADHAAKGATHSAVAGAATHEAIKQVTRNTRRLVIRHGLRSKSSKTQNVKSARGFTPRSPLQSSQHSQATLGSASARGARNSGSRAAIVMAHGGGRAAAGAASSSRGSNPFAGGRGGGASYGGGYGAFGHGGK